MGSLASSKPILEASIVHCLLVSMSTEMGNDGMVRRSVPETSFTAAPDGTMVLPYPAAEAPAKG